MSPLGARVALIAEDIRFLQFLVPAIRRLAAAVGVPLQLLEPQKVRGCRSRLLVELCDRAYAACEWLIVAADASGATHQARVSSHRQKERRLRTFLSRFDAKLLLAIAEPSVEAWLMADGGAFGTGLEAALGRRFEMPHHWPNPRSEREAKEELGRLIRSGTGEILPRLGFEYADEIVGQARLEDSPNPSLASWSRSFVRVLCAR